MMLSWRILKNLLGLVGQWLFKMWRKLNQFWIQSSTNKSTKQVAWLWFVLEISKSILIQISQCIWSLEIQMLSLLQISAQELLLSTLQSLLLRWKINVWIFSWGIRDLTSKKNDLVSWKFKENTLLNWESLKTLSLMHWTTLKDRFWKVNLLLLLLKNSKQRLVKSLKKWSNQMR